MEKALLNILKQYIAFFFISDFAICGFNGLKWTYFLNVFLFSYADQGSMFLINAKTVSILKYNNHLK